MSRFEKLLEAIQQNPKTVVFSDLAKILQRFGYTMHQPNGGSSHNTFRKPGMKPLTVPIHRPYVNEAYVHMIIEALKKEGLL
ncbi:MAG: type II toxin-antitoxin system HicA family toxin [Bacilli bacterium]